MGTATQSLHKLAADWEEADRANPQDHYPFRAELDDALFHSELRFRDYLQYRSEGEFPARLLRWLANVNDGEQKKALFYLLRRLIFIDHFQMRSLYRDAYRRVVVPWITQETFTSLDFIAADFEARLRSVLRKYRLFSITESFSLPDFLHVNDLSGLARPRVLGEDGEHVPTIRALTARRLKGLIILEDFVGSGKQAQAVLIRMRQHAPASWRILFVPLIIMEQGLERLRTEPMLKDVTIEAALTFPQSACISKGAQAGEPTDVARIRAVVRSTGRRVLQKFDDSDDPPTDAFGYGSLGAVIVTCHNSPNNSLPLIHHRAPTWNALFRRVHHSQDGLR